MITGKLKTICHNGKIYTYIEERDGTRHLVKINVGNIIVFELGKVTPIPLTEEFKVNNDTLVKELRERVIFGLDRAADEYERDAWLNILNTLEEFSDETTLSEVLETYTKRGYVD